MCFFNVWKERECERDVCKDEREMTMQYNTIQYNTIQYNTTQYNTVQYNTVPASSTAHEERCHPPAVRHIHFTFTSSEEKGLSEQERLLRSVLLIASKVQGSAAFVVLYGY
jgi:hypothetical protein